jgi:hypothetical protein
MLTFLMLSQIAIAYDYDPGIPDTLRIGYAEVHAGEKAVVPVYFYNDEALGAVQVPLRWLSSDITLDSVSFVDSRVEYLEMKVAGLQESDHQKVVFAAIVFFEAGITPGNGLFAKLYFDVPLGTAPQVIMPDTTIFGPAQVDLLFFDTTGSMSISPVLVRERPGIIYVSGSDADDGNPALPNVNKLSQNYPNPFNPVTKINFSLERKSHVKLIVYNVLAQEITVLADGEFEAGNHEEEWNGTDANGSTVASGVYFYRIITDGFNEARRMVFMK